MEFFGIRLVGVNSANLTKLLLTLGGVAVLYGRGTDVLLQEQPPERQEPEAHEHSHPPGEIGNRALGHHAYTIFIRGIAAGFPIATLT